MKLVKTLLHTQNKVTWKIKLSTKEDFSDTVFQYFWDELKHCNQDMQMELQLVPVFLCLNSVYLVVRLPFRMIFFNNVFCFISFLLEFAIF